MHEVWYKGQRIIVRTSLVTKSKFRKSLPSTGEKVEVHTNKQVNSFYCLTAVQTKQD